MNDVPLREYLDQRFESLEKVIAVEIKRLDRDNERAATKAEAAADIAQRTEDKLEAIGHKLDNVTGKQEGIVGTGRFIAALIAAGAGLIVITSIAANYLTGR